MYTSCFQGHFYDETALSHFELLTKPIYRCNEDRPYSNTQYPYIFVQYHEGYNFVTGKVYHDFKDVRLSITNKTHSATHYTKADVRNRYVIPQESQNF